MPHWSFCSPLCSARQHSVCNVPGNGNRKVGKVLSNQEHRNFHFFSPPGSTTGSLCPFFKPCIPSRPKLPVVTVRIIPTWESSHLGDRMKWRKKKWCRNMTWLWDKLCAALQITAAFGYSVNAAQSILAVSERCSHARGFARPHVWQRLMINNQLPLIKHGQAAVVIICRWISKGAAMHLNLHLYSKACAKSRSLSCNLDEDQSGRNVGWLLYR